MNVCEQQNFSKISGKRKQAAKRSTKFDDLKDLMEIVRYQSVEQTIKSHITEIPNFIR